MDLNETLVQIGLSEKEAQVYLAGLELGQFTMAAISAKSEVKRPTCYLIIEQLIQLGLVSKSPQAKKMTYIAESPDRLEHLIKGKYAKLKEALPHLKSVNTRLKTKPEIRFFKGRRGVEAVYNDVLTDRPKHVSSILNADLLFGVTGKDFLDEWVKNRTNSGIKVDTMMTVSKNMDYYYQSDPKLLRTVTHLPNEMDLGGALWFYGDKVAFVSGKRDDFSFVVQSKEFYKTIYSIFKLIKEKMGEEK